MRTDVEEAGLNVIIFAEWYNVASMMHMKFFDDNTRSWWTPVTGKNMFEHRLAKTSIWLLTSDTQISEGKRDFGFEMIAT